MDIGRDGRLPQAVDELIDARVADAIRRHRIDTREHQRNRSDGGWTREESMGQRDQILKPERLK